MSSSKQKRKILHNPSTQEIFTCLSHMPIYSGILAEHSADKLYSDFLKWLLENDFYNSLEEKITIKKISADFKTDAARVTKWIREIYDDIFELNYDKPELFQKSGTKVCLQLSHYDASCIFYESLQVVPREFEKLNFPFVKAKIGIDWFWVKEVEHDIAEELVITISLKGGTANKYREFAVDKALFQGEINFRDVYEKNQFELDNEIRKIYRD